MSDWCEGLTCSTRRTQVFVSHAANNFLGWYNEKGEVCPVKGCSVGGEHSHCQTCNKIDQVS